MNPLVLQMHAMKRNMAGYVTAHFHATEKSPDVAAAVLASMRLRKITDKLPPNNCPVTTDKMAPAAYSRLFRLTCQTKANGERGGISMSLGL